MDNEAGRTPKSIAGRAWVLADEHGGLIDSIDTDMIFHNRHLHVTDIAEMGQYALGNLPGWEKFPAECQRGDIVVAGENFGCGSSRQQAVDCFRALGVAALVARSFGAIYFRNAVNAGWPVLICPGLSTGILANGDNVRIDIDSAQWWRGDADAAEIPLPPLKPLSGVQREIMAAGGLLGLRAV